MAIAFRAAGTVSTNTGGGAATPGIPAGTTTNDIMVALVVSTRLAALGTPSGWTKKLETDNSTEHKQSIYWKRAGSSESAPSFSGQQFDIQAQIVSFSGCITTGDPFSAASAQANASSTTVTAPAITPANANEMILFLIAWSTTGASTSSFSGYSGTNPTFTEAFDSQFGGGVVHNLSIAGAYGLKTDTTSTGSRTATGSSADLNTGALLSLIPDSAGGSTTLTPGVGEATLQGKTPTTSAFQNVRIRQVLVNEGGQAVANAANITLAVWYSGRLNGAPDVSLNGQTTDANGSTSWSIPTGTLGYNQPIFFVAQDSVSYSNYTCGRIVPSYE